MLEQLPKLKLTNTESREKEVIHTDKDKLKLYTCGPTVYDHAHIGNFRTYIAEDLLKRSLFFFGFPVLHVMNITDVEDKTIRGCKETNQSLTDYTTPFTEGFFEDIKRLNILPADFYPKATDYIEPMIDMIEKLIEKGYAYIGKDKSVYYSLASFPSYGRLSHLCLDELEVGKSNRIEDEYDKENLSDFVLWKSYNEQRDGKVFWQSPFGKGRPGWHMECSCMAIKLLGETVDIHCGGVDNIFPHHENEIAQSEALTGACFSTHWFHVEHLLVDGKKMSKSLQNFYTLRDLLKKGYSAREIRYLLLQTHYKTQLNFTFQGLEGAKASLARIDSFVHRLEKIKEQADKEAEELCEQTLLLFSTSLADDLNISSSLASLFDFIRQANSFMDKKDYFPREKALKLLAKIDEVLGLIFFKIEEKVDEEILNALKKREEARKEKNYALADQLRDFIINKGYEIEDTPQGARVKKK